MGPFREPMAFHLAWSIPTLETSPPSVLRVKASPKAPGTPARLPVE